MALRIFKEAKGQHLHKMPGGRTKAGRVKMAPGPGYKGKYILAEGIVQAQALAQRKYPEWPRFHEIMKNVPEYSGAIPLRAQDRFAYGGFAPSVGFFASTTATRNAWITMEHKENITKAMRAALADLPRWSITVIDYWMDLSIRFAKRIARQKDKGTKSWGEPGDKTPLSQAYEKQGPTLDLQGRTYGRIAITGPKWLAQEYGLSGKRHMGATDAASGRSVGVQPRSRTRRIFKGEDAEG